MKSRRILFLIAALFLFPLLEAGAQNPFSAIGDAIGGVGGNIVSKTGKMATDLIEADQISVAGPKNEYLLGYRVAALILGGHKALPPSHALSQYVDQVGQTVALASEYPYPYRGYMFIVLDTPDINAFAAPGGLVFITTGMFKFLKNEDELAAILGHEIAHVELNHGLRTIQQGRNTQAIGNALKDLASESVEGVDIGPVLGVLADEIYTSVKNGYSSDLEAEADARSAEICAGLGYDASLLLAILERFRSYKGNYGGAGYPAERAGIYAKKLEDGGYIPPAPTPARVERFANALAITP